jgi:hypothetical protein
LLAAFGPERHGVSMSGLPPEVEIAG